VNHGAQKVTLEHQPVVTDRGVASSEDAARDWNTQDFIYVARTPDNIDWWPKRNLVELDPEIGTVPSSGSELIDVRVQKNGKRVGPGTYYYVFRFFVTISPKRRIEGISEPVEFTLPTDLDSTFVEIRNQMIASPSREWRAFGIDTACTDEGSHTIYRPD
jgi:hypothetical protein